MSYDPPTPSGQADSDNSQPVVIASDQTTIPVSIDGVSTSDNQTSGAQKTQIVDPGGETVTVTNGKLDVNATVDTTTLATSTKQDTGNASLSSIDGKITVVDTGAIAGTVTANAGTNLDTSALALEAGGNLAAVATSLSVMDDWDNGASNGAKVSGTVPHDTVDAGEPVKIGGQARSTNPTAVADADRVNAIFDKVGKQVVVGSIRDMKGVQQTTITSSVAETTIVTAVASTFLDLYGLIIANTSATACKVTIKDATSGTTRTIIEVPATDTRGFMLNESAGIVQATANNNWTATCDTSVASIEITALYVRNV